MYVDNNKECSLDASRYTWSEIQGETNRHPVIPVGYKRFDIDLLRIGSFDLSTSDIKDFDCFVAIDRMIIKGSFPRSFELFVKESLRKGKLESYAACSSHELLYRGEIAFESFEFCVGKLSEGKVVGVIVK